MQGRRGDGLEAQGSGSGGKPEAEAELERGAPMASCGTKKAREFERPKGEREPKGERRKQGHGLAVVDAAPGAMHREKGA